MFLYYTEIRRRKGKVSQFSMKLLKIALNFLDKRQNKGYSHNDIGIK